MEQGNKKGKFYCSRCKAIHADGTLRFCADCGGRLVPVEDPRKQSSGVGGMFSKLLKKDGPEDVAIESFGDSAEQGQQSAAVQIPVIRGISAVPVAPEPPTKPLNENPESRPATAPLVEPNAQPRATTEFSTGDLISVTSASPQETSVNLSTGPLKFEPLGQQAQLSPEQIARLASTGELKLLLGKKISDRFLVSELLAGGIGRATYLAVDLQTGGKVLVQMFPGEAFDARPDAQVYGEALRSVARFRDADFGVVLGSGRLPDGRVVVISEYVEGNSIAQVIGFAGAFDVSRAARLVRRIADGVNEAHQYGVFHGSLRAENIVLLRPEDLQDKIKIIGLGVSLADGEALSSGLPTAADDAYDLAVIAYQMLTGRNPFPASAAGNSSSLGTVVPARSIRAELPQQVDYVLNKALSRISAERYSDVRDFGDAFYAALTGAAAPRSSAKQEESLADAGTSERIQVRELFAKEPKHEEPQPKADNLAFEEEEAPVWKKAGRLVAAAVILALIGGGIYFALQSQNPVSAPSLPKNTEPARETNDGPITPRKLEKPADAEVFTNNQADLKGDLARSFIPFEVFYPKNFKRSSSSKNFVEITTADDGGNLVERFIVTKYGSDGTFQRDKDNFTKLVESSNEELRGILGKGYRAISQGETLVQDGRLRAYEVKFEYSGQLNGRDAKLWGRRLWIPVQKDDAKLGFVITLIATDLSKDVRGADDLGTKGALKMILDSFEPGR